MSIVEFKDLTFSYSKGFILENLNLNFKKGRFTAILGESGCGKTTILKLIAGVLTPTSGTIIKNFNKLGVVLQGDSLIENISVIKNIDYISGDRNMSLKALKLVGLENIQKLKGKTLSKGMKKRVEIARALSIEPDLMIMDEPFANLDYFTKLSLITGLKHFISEINATFIYITHDIDEALL
ncbi:MAG: ATP-binding cassette domain-containing protein, partial [Deferribacterales bacterium]